jgi:outer membrane protein assembly factor BamB
MTARTRLLAALVALAGLAVPVGTVSSPDAPKFWPEWRGPLGTGEAPLATPPREWDGTKNVAWKVAIPGVGKSTPVVWQDLVILTTAVPKDDSPQPDLDWTVLAYGRKDGAIKWRRVVKTGKPHEGHHKDGTFASGSALTDGTRIYAFMGSRGLYALDMKGEVLWQKDLGLMKTRNGFGEGSSATVHGSTLVVTWDHEEADFVAAFDSATGKERWRQTRDEPTTWATPHVVVHNGKPQVVVNGTNRLVSYDLATGEPVWQTAGTTLNVIPSPVSANGMVYAMAGFRGNSLKAIKLAEAKGDITGTPAVAFTYDKDTPYVPSPLLYKGGLYFLKSNSGILTQLDAATGAVRYMQRLEAAPNVYASPVGANGLVYIVGREGTTVVLEAGTDFKVVATNVIDEPIDASPAPVDKELYIRGAKHLFKISAGV